MKPGSLTGIDSPARRRCFISNSTTPLAYVLRLSEEKRVRAKHGENNFSRSPFSSNAPERQSRTRKRWDWGWSREMSASAGGPSSPLLEWGQSVQTQPTLQFRLLSWSMDISHSVPRFQDSSKLCSCLHPIPSPLEIDVWYECHSCELLRGETIRVVNAPGWANVLILQTLQS